MSIRDAERALAARLPASATLARLALGATLLVAGVHKFVDPGAWTAFVVDWLEPFVLSPFWFMIANGVFEVVVGAALVADRYTTAAALVVAVSLSATVGYLGVVWVTAGEFGAALVRDFGLSGLGWTVVAAAVRGEEADRGGEAAGDDPVRPRRR